MGGGIRGWLNSVDWQGLLERGSNDRIVNFFTGTYGLALLGVLLLLSVVYKWRIMFVVIAASLALSFVTRYSLTSQEVGPNKTLFLFASGGVAVGAFVIYYLFIRED